MKKFHEAVVSWYLNWLILLTSLIMMLAIGDSFTAIAKFDQLSWMLSIATGITAVTSQTSRFIALKLQKASSLEKLSPLGTLLQFSCDVFLFNLPYSLMQYICLSFMFAIYVFQGVKFLIWDLH